MKDQYVGDINDYVKYSLLRALQYARSGRLLVCWMRTPNDTRGDGRLTDYLGAPDRYRSIDPVLFDALHCLVRDGRRCLPAVEEAELIPRANYFGALLGDGAASREGFLDGLHEAIADEDLVFFDPDNGLDVASVPLGRLGSRRYLYTRDVPPLLDGRSGVIYQHFPRENRAAYVARRLAGLSGALPTHEFFAVCSSRVAYLFAALPDAAPELRRGAVAAVRSWRGDLWLAET